MAKFNYDAHRLEQAQVEGHLIDAGHGVRYTLRPARRPKGSFNQHLTIWSGKAKKPVYNYLIQEDDFARNLKRHVDSAKAWEVTKAERKAEKAANLAEMRKTVKVGTLLHETSSYNMTYVDFFEVIEISKSGATATVHQIGSMSCTGDNFTGTKRPLPGTFLASKEPFKLRITACGVGKMGVTEADQSHSWNTLD